MHRSAYVPIYFSHYVIKDLRSEQGKNVVGSPKEMDGPTASEILQC